MKKLLSPQLFCVLVCLGIGACSDKAFQPKPPVVPPGQVIIPEVPPAPIMNENRYYLSDWFGPFGAISTPITKSPIVSFSLPQPERKADLSFLKVDATTGEPNYIALGGSMTMGYRDGGIHRAGQLTAYPNLIARQMGLTNFRSPLFGENEANGTGYMVFSDKDGIPEWQQVTNNRAIVTETPLTFTPYQGEVDNLGAPGAGMGMHNRFYDGRIQSVFDLFDTRLRSIEERKKQSLLEYTKSRKPALLTLEKEMERVMALALSADNRNVGLGLVTGAESYGQRQILTYMKEENVKGVVFLIPNLLDLPYFRLIKLKTFKEKLGVSKVMVHNALGGGVQEEATDQTLFVPKSSLLYLLRGPKRSGEILGLADNESFTKSEMGAFSVVKILNQALRKDAEEFGIPVFDLGALYEKVMAGQYVSEDGFKIDGSFPNGNFFSQDGIYPSAIGHAVIANEIIKLLNTSYKSNIPLIHLGNFARAVQ